MQKQETQVPSPKRKKTARILALAGALLLASLYGITLVFALFKSPHADRLLMASIFCTLFIPVLLYGIQLIRKVASRKK
jgi:high-affinity Fe2+/Pb2+ permease